MTDYRIHLHDFPGIDSATQAFMLDADRALLEHELGCSFLARQAFHCLEQEPDHVLSRLALLVSMTSQPFTGSIHTWVADWMLTARQQIVGDLLLDFLHLLAAGPEALLLLLLHGAGLGCLVNDRRGPQLLFGGDRLGCGRVEQQHGCVAVGRLGY